MKYDINRPWESLDDWQKEYIFNTHPEENCFLLCGRQTGKTTAMSIKAVELCLNYFKKGEYILICSITEKQAYHMLAKALTYAEIKYPTQIKKGKERPTMHKINFKNGTGILCFAAGETGEGLRGYTIKKLMIDEGSRMSDEFFIAVSPMLSVVRGSMDIASTPCGKQGFFYKCSLDNKYKQFFVSAEDCPRHDKSFLDSERNRLSKLAYAQEYLAVFIDELKRLFSDELIYKVCCAKDKAIINRNNKHYVGVDVAALGNDDSTIEIIENINNNIFIHKANFVLKRLKTNQLSEKIFNINSAFPITRIGIDDAGVGFGLWSELVSDDRTKRKVVALNNVTRPLDSTGEKTKHLLKEEMYFNLLNLMEKGKIQLLDDDEVRASLSSIQFEIITKKDKKAVTKIWGSNSHIAEGIIRAVWLAEKGKDLNIFARSF